MIKDNMYHAPYMVEMLTHSYRYDWHDQARALGRCFDLNEAGLYSSMQIPGHEATYRGKARINYIMYHMDNGGLEEVLGGGIKLLT